ncbi:helix-turn-helix domain-containing protein [Natronoglycomyces albus]|uniref:Helix-turn-helix domain-containing protein n=1 Tax=Natronoglycomyces albus TaxID=2811108 RepID=A0A895XS72_9ACTN|nr:helix-turn-helix domain-containing protein [Natronoglycomyces albus]
MTNDQRNAIAAAWRAGERQADIAQQFGVSLSSVKRIVRDSTKS